MSATLAYVTAEQIGEALTPAGAVGAIEEALRAGLDPAVGPKRSILDVASGQLLLMPAETAGAVGVKVATVAPANPERGLPRIQGVYVLFDAATLTPRALLDGTALTTLRTPAVSVAAVRPALLRESGPLHLTVFGAGPQGTGHVDTVAGVVEGHRPLGTVTHVVRDPSAATGALREGASLVAAGSPEAAEAVARAHVVVCATGSGTPVFDSGLARPDVVVIAVGSHDTDRREVDGALVGRAQVVVEDVATALREGGDVVMAIAETDLTESDLIPMADVVTGRAVLSADRPVVFKSSGMPWEDVVVAEAVVARLQG